jgi:hypothetical protein
MAAKTKFRTDDVPNMASVLKSPMDAITRHHYENLAGNKQYINPKTGRVSTVYTMQVDIGGKPTLIPTVWDGEIIKDEEEATKRAIDSGINWPQRSTHEELREFDKKIHKTMRPISAKDAQRILDAKMNPY